MFHRIRIACWSISATAVLTVLVVLTGCRSDPPTPQGATGSNSPKTGTHKGDSVEHWFADYAGDSHIGSTHIVSQPQSDPPKTVRLTLENEISIKRFGSDIAQQLTLTWNETSDGNLISFESRKSSGGDIEVTKGRVQGNKLILTTETTGQKQETSLDWNSEWGGFYAVEQSLAKRPLQPGEKRSLTALVSGFNQVGRFTLEAVDYENTDVLGKSENLLRTKMAVHLGEGRVESIVWTDRAGEMIKSYVPAFPLTTYRATKATAQLHAKKSEYDLGEAMLVRVRNIPPELSDKYDVVYHARFLDGGDISGIFPTDAFQQVRILEKQTAEIHVQTVRPDTAIAADIQQTPPQDADREANARIQSDHPAVAKLAAEASPDETDPWKVAVRLERLVRERMRPQPFAPALASAGTVATTLQGDCTEHAVLLAALCRHRGIPARIAIGLVYSSADRAYAYHMWTEVWITDRWIPLDSTRGRGGNSAAYVKLTHSSMQAGDDASAFLPAFQVMGRLELEIVSAK